MRTSRFWLVAALLGVGAAIGCGDGRDATGTPAVPESPSAPADPPAAAHGAAPVDPGPAAGAHAQATAPATAAAGSEGPAPLSFDAPPPVGTRARCPVMGHDFVVAADTPRSEHAGRHYAFCCPACKPRFDANPAQFLAAAANPS